MNRKTFPQNKDTFRPSHFTIRVKLLLIISGILIAALSGMIFVATYYFRDYSKKLIQEYNLGQAQLIGVKLNEELDHLSYSVRQLSAIINERGIPAQRRDAYVADFFAYNPDVVFIGLGAATLQNSAPESGEPENARTIQLRHSYYNQEFMRRNELRTEAVGAAINDGTGRLRTAFEGNTAIKDLGELNGIPLLAIAVPLIRGQPGPVVMVIMEADHLLRSVRESGITEIFQIFLVNERGELLSRFHNTEITPESARTIPIVKNLLGSGSDNGSQEYSYEDKEYLGSYQIISFGRIGIVSTVPADRAFEAVYLIQAQNLKIMLIVLVLAFLFVYFFARTLSAPIRRLLRATGRIEDGDYDVDIAPTTHDEIGTLTNSFISMAHGLAERQKIKDTFGKFVNPAIVNRALNSDLRLGGEERICTILFSDLRNFTGMSEKLKPEEVVSILTEYFTRMVDCVHDEGGVVDKFIGDAVMAHWGALVANPGDPSSAVRAALRMRTALLELNSDSFRKRGLNLRFGIGINTGTVLAGQIGSERRLEYTVIGDAVNLTSRIEYLNKHFGTDILISHYTYEKLDPIFHTVELPPIQIKGKSNPETVYAVLGLRNNPATPASLNELRELLSIEYNPDIARKYIEASSDIILDEKALFEK